MTECVSTTAKIRLTLEIDWPHSFGEKATAQDIYTTAARECETIMRNALNNASVRFRVIGDIEPLMVIVPVKR